MPSPQNVGKLYGLYRNVGSKGLVDEAIHHKAEESRMFTRSQESTILQRRASCTAKNCATIFCSNYTYNLTGYCDVHNDENAIIKELDKKREEHIHHHNHHLHDETIKGNGDGEFNAQGDFIEDNEVRANKFTKMEDLRIKLEKKIKEVEEAEQNDDIPDKDKPKLTQDEIDLKHYIQATDLRDEMYKTMHRYEPNNGKFVECMSSTSSNKSTVFDEYIQTARSHFNMFPPVDDTELGQLYEQFIRLDFDGDGLITPKDICDLALYVDPNYSRVKPHELLNKAKGWMASTFYHHVNQEDIKRALERGLDAMELIEIDINFLSYVEVVLLRRKNDLKVYDGALYPFWCIRDCMVYSISKNRKCEGWAYKRGDTTLIGKLNAWRKRYFRLTESKDKRPIFEYFDFDPNDFTVEDMKLKESKGLIELTNLLAIDFSPKTETPKSKDFPEENNEIENYVVFKILVSTGRRYVLAADKSTAIEWTSKLSWYGFASNRTESWKTEHGFGSEKITLLYWLHAAQVIVKIEKYCAALTEGKGQLEKAKETKSILAKLAFWANEEKKSEWDESAAKQAVFKTQKDIVRETIEHEITKSDLRKLQVCNIKGSDLKGGMKLVKQGIMAWQYSHTLLEAADSLFTAGGIGYTIRGIIGAATVYGYAAVANNEYHKARYQVQWESKMGSRCCGVCGTIFKSVSFRKELGKRHCRTCGRVICYPCSTTKLYLDMNDQLKIICDECVVNGGPETRYRCRFESNAVVATIKKEQAAKVQAAEEKGKEVSHNGFFMFKGMSKYLPSSPTK